MRKLRSAKKCANTGRNGTHIATTTERRPDIVTFTVMEIEPDAYQTNGEKLDDTLI
ncbi:MAG: hypothetical protein GWN00_27190 [Aliifodinibius sp.]|nr:hypothetical protein [Fodinibius sp.]NIV14515.1 hypothetical protein [Fodinibius sp.]NIY28354.1 hypothetical protein [Fodinibius sp.]